MLYNNNQRNINLEYGNKTSRRKKKYIHRTY